MFFLEGEVDIAILPLMTTAISDAVSRGGPLTIDMSGVTFIDSSGVGAIVNFVKALPKGCIILHDVRDATQRVIDLMGVGQAPKLHVIPCTVPV